MKEFFLFLFFVEYKTDFNELTERLLQILPVGSTKVVSSFSIWGLSDTQIKEFVKFLGQNHYTKFRFVTWQKKLRVERIR